MTDKLDLVLDNIKDLKDSHGKRLDSIDDNLATHMRRTEMLEDRVEKLELPGKVLKFLRQAALWVCAIAGVVLTIAKVIGLFGV